MAIVYEHRRNDTNEVFYVGIGKYERRVYGKYPKFLDTTLDAYHLIKYFMILFLAISCVNYVQVLPKFYIFGVPLNLDIAALFIVWGLGFKISRKIFKK